MKVNVKVVGSLKRYTPREEFQVEVKEDTKLKDLKTLVGIPPGHPVGYVLNGLAVDQDYQVHHQDTVLFVMVVGGG